MSRTENRSPSTAHPAPATPLHAGSHRYAIDYTRVDGTRIGSITVDPDFQAARECAYFAAVRRGVLPAVSAAANGNVSPVWCDERGAPYCRSIRIDFEPPPGQEPFHHEVSNDYFQILAERGAQDWVAQGQLEPGEQYRYHVCAYPVIRALRESGIAASAEQSSPDASLDFRVEAVPSLISVSSSPLAAFQARAVARGPSHADDAPVFIPQSVLDEARALASDAGANETGGVLIGHLRHDASVPESFTEITAQIPARHAEASGTSFAFTPATWAATDAAIELRGRDELILGWWHSHPRFCHPECPPERQRACPFARAFFSLDDTHLHGVCFPQAYQTALLISDLPGSGPTPAVFGWRGGVVTERGYSTLESQP